MTKTPLTREQADEILDLVSTARHTARTASRAGLGTHADIAAAYEADDEAWRTVIREVYGLTNLT